MEAVHLFPHSVDCFHEDVFHFAAVDLAVGLEPLTAFPNPMEAVPQDVPLRRGPPESDLMNDASSSTRPPRGWRLPS